jgi:hypothetical protein
MRHSQLTLRLRRPKRQKMSAGRRRGLTVAPSGRRWLPSAGSVSRVVRQQEKTAGALRTGGTPVSLSHSSELTVGAASRQSVPLPHSSELIVGPASRRSAKPRWAGGHVQQRSTSILYPRLRIAGILALLTIAIVSHGCHGQDVDDELSAVQMPRTEKRSTRPSVGPLHTTSTSLRPSARDASG